MTGNITGGERDAFFRSFRTTDIQDIHMAQEETQNPKYEEHYINYGY